MTTLSVVLREAEDFLLPVLSGVNKTFSQNDTLLDHIDVRSTSAEVQPAGDSAPRRVARRALTLVLSIHQSASESQNQDTVLDSRLMRLVSGLLDVISIIAILPNLSDGMPFFPDRPRKSVLDERLVANSLLLLRGQQQRRDDELLGEVVEGLDGVARDAERGVGPMLRDRVLVDFVCGAAEVAFSPVVEGDVRERYGYVFGVMIQRMFTPTLMPLLTSLMQPIAPAWFRSKLSEILSLVPLRPYGARQVIEFIATSHLTSMDSVSSDASKGPLIPLEALEQATKLLSSVPKTMAAETYFEKLAPQLIEMLDGAAGPELIRAAAHVMGRGILGRRSTGQPGAVGWRLLVEPIQQAINPKLDNAKAAPSTLRSLGDPVVPEPQLRVALQRLTALVTSHPSPSLCRRLCGPLMLPLWGLLCFARPRRLAALWSEMPRRLLTEYIRLCASDKELRLLVESVLWDGTAKWTYGPGSEGGIEIRQRDHERNMLELISDVDERVTTFIDLLATKEMDSEIVGSVFLVLIRNWLFPTRRAQGESEFLGSGADDVEPLQTLVTAKLAQAMLERLEGKVAGSTPQIVQLVCEVLDQYVETRRMAGERRKAEGKPTYSNLGQIAGPNVGGPTTSGSDGAAVQRAVRLESDLSDTENADLVSIALSLVTNMVSMPDFRVTPLMRESLEPILPILDHIAYDRSVTATENPAVSLAAKNLQTLISSKLGAQTTTTSQSDTTTAANRTTLTNALHSFTASPDPPTRVAALHTLHALISAASPALATDIPAVAVTLQDAVLSDADEYVYLAAIRTLAALAALGPSLVTGIVVNSFVNAGGSGKKEGDGDGEKGGEVGCLEGRLRIGEVLGEMVAVFAGSDSSSSADAGTGRGVKRDEADAATRKIADAAMAVASRRGKKGGKVAGQETDKTSTDRHELLVGASKGSQLDDTETADVDADADHKLLQRIVYGWADTGAEEDVRLRTSALSVLSRVLELAIAAVDGGAVERAVQALLAVLSVETGVEKAILRRAAVMGVMSLLRGVDGFNENDDRGRSGGGGRSTTLVGGDVWGRVERVLGWVVDVDGDEIVRGHAGVVLESLEAWRMKMVMGASAADAGVSFGVGRAGLPGGGLRGLVVNPDRGKERLGKVEEVD